MITGNELGVTLEDIIEQIRATGEDEWAGDVVRSKDGDRNCFFGHLFAMGRNDAEGNLLWEWFEERWATTFMVYRVNDGQHPDYQQPTPRQRVLAYLEALRDGREDDTHTSMEKDAAAMHRAEVSP